MIRAGRSTRIEERKTARTAKRRSRRIRLLVLVGAFVAVAVAACRNADHVFYHPDHNVYLTPAAYGLRFDDETFSSADGTKLTGWFVPATTSKALGTIVQVHGNAQNMTSHFAFMAWLPAEGFNVFVFDYRGYGASEGSPTRRGLYEDTMAALQHVRQRADVDPAKIIVIGQSLGGANALAVLGGESETLHGFAGVVADSAFSSYLGVARDHAGTTLRPVANLLIRDTLSPIDVVHRISPTPLLIIAGTADPVVPDRHARLLEQAAREPKELWLLEGAGHTEIFGPRLPQYRNRLLALFRQWVGADRTVTGDPLAAP